jgi:hypothetical protein
MRNNIVTKATAALAESVGSILASGGEGQAEALAQTFAEAEAFLLKNLAGDAGADVAKANRDRRAGHHGLAAAVTEHALDRLDYLRRKHGFAKGSQPEKDSAMSSVSLDSILKDYGAVKICKYIVDTGKTGYDEHTLTAALTKRASEMYPDLSEAQAFAKLYAEPDVWRACAIAKATMLDLQPVVVTGDELRDEDDREQAMKQLAEIGRRMAPTATPEKQFSDAFAAHPDLARRAHVRPSPTTFFPMPR